MPNNLETNNTNIKQLLSMFWASVHIQEEFMWKKPEQNNKFNYGHYKKTYKTILREFQKLYQIENLIESRIFNLSDSWSNDLFDIIDTLVEEEFGNKSQESKDKYFAKYVQKYVDEYIKNYMNE